MPDRAYEWNLVVHFNPLTDQPSITTSTNPSVVNTICIIQSATLMGLPQENFN